MGRLLACFMMALCLAPLLAFADGDQPQAEGLAASRFKLDGGEALDQATNLIWSRCSLGTTWEKGSGCLGEPQLMTLAEAEQLAQKLGHGWRVPDIEELFSLVEPGTGGKAINSEVFPDIRDLGDGAPYWSVTRMEELPQLVYYVDFLTGQVDGHSEGFVMAVRLVRNAAE